jgi:hypothetical protein
VLIDIHLDELDLAFGVADNLFQDRRELLAGTAPGRPEINEHRLAFGFLDDVLDKGLRGRVGDQRISRHCRNIVRHQSSLSNRSKSSNKWVIAAVNAIAFSRSRQV